jgi:hypothetical protein
LNVEIDKLTPCLEKVSTGEIVKTTYEETTPPELAKLKNWLFNWTDPRLNDCAIFKLLACDDSRIQGLVAIKDEPANNAIYVKITESAPHNKGKTKEYLGVGGHLYAIATLISLSKGYGGFVYMDAKNMRLVNHYIKILGASFVGGVHPFRVSINEVDAQRLIKFYNFKED